ncbi:polysaccharide biosynthesis protein [Flavobacterium sp. xlx-214]|uniref:polysaccharide biosynthesis protein n=1 Tax=unclassified Flavobacterium TaxID=196869 RepID=UPI0013D53069|nr:MULTISPECIES: nucleoside-diphosphate sugar epimerase/dehydratase [unclassified Flavobacterium]MBA5791234.1 polysaccharide biosynthesis protein [Flavobacterium sp. xlx-221]QMI83599.1 polysaccharide biosynthesis protein [Flavobacterium sp. xlx-214]
MNFTKDIHTYFSDLKKIQYLPRWIIFSIDVAIVIFSAIVGHFILKGIGIDFRPITNVPLVFCLYLITHLFFFWYFKTYTGIVRHTTLLDAGKIFFVELLCFVTLYLANTIVTLVTGNRLFLNTRLLICVSVAYVTLLVFRLLIKTTFDFFAEYSQTNHYTKAVIYGSGERAIAIANAINAEIPKKYKLQGFISPSTKTSYNRILNIPIIAKTRKISVLTRALGANTLIIADENLSKDDKIEIIEDCLNYNIKVYNLPRLTDINDQKKVASNIRKIKIEDLLERKPIQINNLQISDQIKDKVVLVSGAAGSIGSEIVWQVASFNPKKLILLDQAETPLHHITLEISKCNTTAEIISIIADVRNLECLERVFSDYTPDLVYHAAAYKHVPLMEMNPQQAVFTNVLGSKHMADLAYKYKAERFVMVSTDKAVNPSNVMGASKRIAEKYVQSLAQKLKKENNETTKYITTRFGNVLGSNGSVVPLFTKQIENGGPITITHPDIIRYFMTIPEACQLVLEAGSMGNGGEIYIFDMGKPVKIIDLATKMVKLAGLEPQKDIEIKVVGLRPGEKLYEELLNDSSTTLATHHEKIMIAQDIHENYEDISIDIEKLKQFASAYLITDTVATMKKIVPEFKSLNSTFEKLD